MTRDMYENDVNINLTTEIKFSLLKNLKD